MWPYCTLVILLAAQVLPLAAKEYVVPPGDVAAFFASLPGDATTVSFSAASTYRAEGDIVLPDAVLLVIDGRGATLRLGPGSNGFTRRITDQKDAQRRTSSRYLIKDFAAIEGGRKAVDLAASLGSIISNCRFVGQSVAAVDLRFCLMTRVQNVLVTSPKDRGIVVRHGDWPGATGTNSQSNSTVLDQCRVYASVTTSQAFAIINSGGVRMLDCISEGERCDYDIFLTATLDGDETKRATNPVVKSFTVENFHVEHRVRKASIYVNMPPKSVVSLRNIYWNNPQEQPVVLYTGGQLNLMDLGWWRSDFKIRSRVRKPHILVARAPSQLNLGDALLRTRTRAGSFELGDALPGEHELDPAHIRVIQSAH
jgi:hypothetical protein